MASVVEEGEIVEYLPSQAGDEEHGAKRLKLAENKYKAFLFTEFSQDIEGNDLEELAHKKIPIRFAREVSRIATREAEKLEEEMEKRLKTQALQIKNLTFLLEEANRKGDRVADRYQAELVLVSKDRDEAAKARDRLITNLAVPSDIKKEQAKVLQLEEKMRQTIQNAGDRVHNVKNELEKVRKENGAAGQQIGKLRAELRGKDTQLEARVKLLNQQHEARVKDVQHELSRVQTEHAVAVRQIEWFRSELQEKDARIASLSADFSVNQRLREDAEKRAQDAERRVQAPESRARNSNARPWDAAFAGTMRTGNADIDVGSRNVLGQGQNQNNINTAANANGRCWNAAYARLISQINASADATVAAKKALGQDQAETAAVAGQAGRGEGQVNASVEQRPWEAALAAQMGKVKAEVDENLAPKKALSQERSGAAVPAGQMETVKANAAADVEGTSCNTPFADHIKKEPADVDANAAPKKMPGHSRPDMFGFAAFAGQTGTSKTNAAANVEKKVSGSPFADQLRKINATLDANDGKASWQRKLRQSGLKSTRFAGQMDAVKATAGANVAASKSTLRGAQSETSSQSEVSSRAVAKDSVSGDGSVASGSTLVEAEPEPEPESKPGLGPGPEAKTRIIEMD